LDKVKWYELSRNKNALHLLCKLDYSKMKQSIQPLKKEIVEKVFNPTRLFKISEKYNIDFDELVEIY